REPDRNAKSNRTTRVENIEINVKRAVGNGMELYPLEQGLPVFPIDFQIDELRSAYREQLLDLQFTHMEKNIFLDRRSVEDGWNSHVLPELTGRFPACFPNLTFQCDNFWLHNGI